MMPILVTGGAKGLGAEICRQLAAQGHDVVIHYRTNQTLAQKVTEECRKQKIEAETIQGDFSTVDSVEAFINSYLERFPKTKGIVNNVGNYLIAPVDETKNAQWLDLFQTNFFAPLFLTQALLPAIKAQKGCIVNIGVTGLHANRAFTKTAAYAATKSALLFYTVSLAKMLASESVRVNMVSPGYLENAVDLGKPSSLPLKRPAFLREVAQVVAYFFAPSSVYITGQNLEVAGGIGL